MHKFFEYIHQQFNRSVPQGAFAFDVETEDKVRISALHYKKGHDKVIVLAHGFYNNKEVYLFREMAQRLSHDYDVVSFDFRGHGKSSGLFSWTTHENKDLKAVIDYLKDEGYASLGIMGFSLGAAVSLIEASRNRHIKTVIAVSGPSDFWKIDYRFWEPEMLEDLKLNLGPKGIGKGIRPGNPFGPKLAPMNIVDRIAPTPVFFIHGKDDWLIKPWHSERLYAQAQEPKRLLIMENVGHAEIIFDKEPDVFMQACLDWFFQNL